MVRVFFLSLLTLFVGTALAKQEILSNPSAQPAKWSYEICGASEDQVVQIESITLAPDPPVPGEALTVTVNGTAQDSIEEGAYANVIVKLGIIKLLTKRFDVCEEARKANAGVQCPVEPGSYTVSQTVQLPKEIPQAKFSVHVDGYTVDDDDLLCLDLVVDFRKFPFPGLW